MPVRIGLLGSFTCHIWLQPLSPTVTASVTYGCSLCHVRLQVLIGLLGSFEEGFNLFLRILAIFLSIVGAP